MAEPEAPPAWVAEQLAGALGFDADVVFIERRPSADLYRADGRNGSLLVKVGPLARLAHEANALQLAATLVGDLAPAFIGCTETGDGHGLIAMEYVQGKQLEPGGLTRSTWQALADGLVRLHSQLPDVPSLCAPLAPDFVTLSVGEGRYASLSELRPLLAVQAARVPSMDIDLVLGLFDKLSADVATNPALFERSPSWVHGDIWPENVLTSESRCWLVDWTWLKRSDYALDLANLKLMLDWVWSPVRAHIALESLLRRYASVFADDTLLARMRFFLPLVSLIHLIQFGEGGADDPGNAAAMKACLATARRDRTLWSLSGSHRRLWFATVVRRQSAYGVWDTQGVRERASRVKARLLPGGRHMLASRLHPRSPGGPRRTVLTPPPEQRLASSALSQFGSTIVGLAFGAILSVVLARALGAAEMGSFSLALVIVAGLQAVAGFGLARTALRFTAEVAPGSTTASALWWLLVRRLAWAVVAAVALVAAAPLIAVFFSDALLTPLLVIGAGLLLAELVGGVLESALEGSSRFSLLARVAVVLTPLHFVMTLAALAVGAGAVGVMLVQLMSALISLVLMALLSRRTGLLAWRPPQPDAALVGRMVRFARQGYILSMVSFVVHDRTEVLVLGALATSEQVGFYSVALSTAEAAMSVGPWIVAAIFFPLLVTDWAGADRAALAARYRQCVRYLALAAAPLALGGIVVADAIVAVVFGSAYSPMVPALQVVLVAAAAAALAQGPSSVLAAAERQDWLVRVRMPLAAANILLSIALVPRFAAVGAAWANLAVATTEALVLGVLAWRLGAPVPGFGLLVPFVSAGVAAAAAALVIRDRTDPVALAMSIVVAIPVYFGVLVVFRFFRPEDAVVIRPLLARLRHPSAAVCCA